MQIYHLRLAIQPIRLKYYQKSTKENLLQKEWLLMSSHTQSLLMKTSLSSFHNFTLVAPLEQCSLGCQRTTTVLFILCP